MSNTRKNIMYNSIYQLIIMIIPFITAPYVARVLGAEKTGIYSYTYNIAYYFAMLSMLGINNYGNREVARVRSDKEKLSKTFFSIYTIQIFMALLMTILYYIYICTGVKTNQCIAIIQGLYIIAQIFDVNWFFVGMEKFKLTINLSTIIRVISLILILLFVKKKNDITIYALILAGSTLLNKLVQMFFIKKYIKFVKIGIKDITKNIKPCLILFLPVISVSIYKFMDKIMLGNRAGMLQLGYYENAEKIIKIPITLCTTIAVVMLPKISNLVANGDTKSTEKYIKKSIEFEFIVSSSIVFGIIAVASIFVPTFLGNEFTNSSIIVQYLAITIIFIAVASVIRTQYLIPYGKDKVYAVSLIIGAILNFITNLIFIPKYGALGATIGTIIAEFSVFSYQAFMVRKQIKIGQYIKSGFKYIILGMIMCILVSTFYINVDNVIILLMLKVLLGIIIYVFGLILIKMIQYKEKNPKNVFLKLKNLE